MQLNSYNKTCLFGIFIDIGFVNIKQGCCRDAMTVTLFYVWMKLNNNSIELCYDNALHSVKKVQRKDELLLLLLLLFINYNS